MDALRRGPGALRPAGAAGGSRRARRPRAGPPPRAPGEEAAPSPRPSPSRRRSTTTSTSATTRSASSATSASRRAARTPRTRSRSPVAGRGFDARISTEQAVPLPESACVYCGNCIGVCPTGALMSKPEYDMREAGTWDESAQTVTDTICPYCGVGCAVDAPRPGRPDRQGHLAARLVGDRRPPVHQGPLRLRVRQRRRPKALTARRTRGSGHVGPGRDGSPRRRRTVASGSRRPAPRGRPRWACKPARRRIASGVATIGLPGARR